VSIGRDKVRADRAHCSRVAADWPFAGDGSGPFFHPYRRHAGIYSGRAAGRHYDRGFADHDF